MDGKVYDVLSFVVRDNVLSYGKSFITISNITKVTVDTPSRSKPLLKWSISLLLSGFFLSLISSKSMLLGNMMGIGVIMLILGGVLLFFWGYKAPSPCLMIYLSSGEYVGFSSSNITFLHQTVINLKECINSKKSMTVDLSSSNIIGGDVKIQNATVGTGHATVNSPIVDRGSNLVNGNKNTATSSYIENIDWETLRNELISMKKQIAINSNERKLVDDSLSYLYKNDKKGFLNYFKEHKNEFLSDVFSNAAGATLVAILSQIGNLIMQHI